MTQHFKLNIEFIDTSYFSLVGGLEEILNKLKNEEDNIQFGKNLFYESSYEDSPDFGKYSVAVEIIKE